MARKLTRKQKDYIESIATSGKCNLTEDEIAHVESIKFYETAHTDAGRYLMDLMFQKRLDEKRGNYFGWERVNGT